MFKKLNEYNRISKFIPTARRYFINNFYDGILTVSGILIALFTIILNDPNAIVESRYIIMTGIGTSISMFISGISGSYLSEKAEQRKQHEELDRAMGIIERYEEIESNEEIQKAMLRKHPIKEIRIKADGLLSQALEHEIDHLNGVLYIDHLEDPDSLRKIEPEDLEI